MAEEKKPPTKKDKLEALLWAIREGIQTYSETHMHLFINHLRERGYMTDQQVIEALESFNESLESPID